jgi:DNA-binding transcriptional ArsR family regulator
MEENMTATTFLMTAAAVADPTRLRMLLRLGSGPLPVGQLGAIVGVTQPAASYHVRLMREAGLISVERRGRRTLVRRLERRWAAIVRALATAD